MKQLYMQPCSTESTRLQPNSDKTCVAIFLRVKHLYGHSFMLNYTTYSQHYSIKSMAKVEKRSRNTKCLSPSQCVVAVVAPAKGKRSHWFWWGFEALGGARVYDSCWLFHSCQSKMVHAGIPSVKSVSLGFLLTIQKTNL